MRMFQRRARNAGLRPGAMETSFVFNAPARGAALRTRILPPAGLLFVAHNARTAMIKTLKLWKLAGDLKAKGNAPEAFSAVVELGKVGGSKAVDLLLVALARHDGVARSAARELGLL